VQKISGFTQRAEVTSVVESRRPGAGLLQRFSRHRSLATLQKYDDNRADLGGDVARRVAAAAS
jgi:hypothetical protein